MLPEKFKERAKGLLGGEYESFIRTLETEDRVRGLRVNLTKTDKEGFLSVYKEHLTALPYVDNGFIIDSDVKIGNTPEHHSGMIYVQDPGAMATLSALELEPDWYVADLCAAPGGKSSQIAERLGEGGFLLSNEYVPKRAKIIVGNLERMGTRNAVVTSMDTAELARLFHCLFDLVVVDAPCSGEGMFRKSSEALEEWSEDNVRLCAERQSEILENGSRLVKPCGYLLYSTCTYSPEENEMVVDRFLRLHPEFHLADVKEELRAATKDGIAFPGAECDELYKCRRFYPHISPGEGQFLALMKRIDDGEQSTILYKETVKPLTKQEDAIIKAFFKEALCRSPVGRIVKVGDNPVIIPHGCPIPPHAVFMSGVLIGEIKGNILRPSHQFFSAYGKLFKTCVNLEPGDPRVEAYLSGAEIPCERDVHGWCCVTYHGTPLGGGKISSGVVKNHYPKGLRLK